MPGPVFYGQLSDTVDCEDSSVPISPVPLPSVFLCPDPYGYALDDEPLPLPSAGEHEVEREIGNTDSEAGASRDNSCRDNSSVRLY